MTNGTDTTAGEPGIPEQLRSLAEELDARADEGDAPEIREPVDRLKEAALEIGRAWSGSSFGFHANVYYADFEAPPPGSHFSSEWGFKGTFHGTTGDWHEYKPEDVRDVITKLADEPDLSNVEEASAATRLFFENRQSDVVSLLSVASEGQEDEFLDKVKSSSESVAAISESQAAAAQLPQGGQFMSRDTDALLQGLWLAPHQEVLARVAALKAPFGACRELARAALQGASHLERRTLKAAGIGTAEVGQRVFIGHGGSPLWRELKDFVQDRLGLSTDEFNRVPAAGVTNQARLAEMMDNAGIALLVLTAEDEQADGKVSARQNVVHEAGLFQGRLGFTRAILLFEEGCEEFSNIQGLGQIRFPSGKIGAAFEEVRRVMEREGFVDPVA